MIQNNPKITIVDIDHPAYNGKGGLFYLEEPLEFTYLNGKLKKVPKGFLTDFASIPPLFRFITPVNVNHRLPAIVHDYLYYVLSQVKYNNKSFSDYNMPFFNRKDADKLLYLEMKQKKSTKLEQFVFYPVLRLFGGLNLWRTSKLPVVIKRFKLKK